ncbi:methylamine dehydrogenase light chain [Novosphingobium sp. BW1]|uniref:methylamine dehydrogenase light chain n=1 Tax=Novosphingobium sp. BW1 TaxID=2592621 RepID=UPI0011DEF87B|nr:methylamine dehydrogenase light chain [Novosphingobium sp. BW1]TYC90484.1 methylamine dehydrogenase (amicyanin) light chain [Novosphingobium sp. BW1]
MNWKLIDSASEKLSRGLAKGTSRRSLLAKVGGAASFAPFFPVLPVARAQDADVPLSNFARTAQTKDDTQCNYWRYCAIDGALCTCCGGGIHTCPPGTEASPTSWVGTCRNPEDGRSYLIAYRDCCGASMCQTDCHCDGTEREMPAYRPMADNEIIWCFGTKSMSYHCSTAALVGPV